MPAGPTAPDVVHRWGKLGQTVEVDDPDLVDVVAAVNALVVRHGYADPASWTADVRLGTRILAARWWRRRNSPGGVEQVTDAGPVYVRRTDPDVAELLPRMYRPVAR